MIIGADIYLAEVSFRPIGNHIVCISFLSEISFSLLKGKNSARAARTNKFIENLNSFLHNCG